MTWCSYTGVKTWQCERPFTWQCVRIPPMQQRTIKHGCHLLHSCIYCVWYGSIPIPCLQCDFFKQNRYSFLKNSLMIYMLLFGPGNKVLLKKSWKYHEILSWWCTNPENIWLSRSNYSGQQKYLGQNMTRYEIKFWCAHVTH